MIFCNLDSPFNSIVLKWLCVCTLMSSVFTTSSVFAEEMICFPSPCPNRQTHVEYSLDKSVLAVAGSFEFSSEEVKNFENLNGRKNSLKVTFSIKEIVKGSVSGDYLQLKLPVSFVLPGARGNSNISQDLLQKWLVSVKNISKNSPLTYYEKNEKLIVKGIIDRNYVSVDVAVAEVAFGGLDFTIRESQVPIFEGQDYMVFFFREILHPDEVIFPWDYSVYLLEAYLQF